MKTIKEILELDLPVFRKAYEMAQEVHKEQKRSDGKPYMTHIDAVIENVYNDNPLIFGNFEHEIEHHKDSFNKIEGECLLVIASLHDSVEDNPDKISFISIKESLTGMLTPLWIGAISAGIKAITKLEKGKESYVDYVLRVKYNGFANVVKRSDLKHNSSDLKPGNMLDKYQLTMYVLNEK